MKRESKSPKSIIYIQDNEATKRQQKKTNNSQFRIRMSEKKRRMNTGEKERK